MAVLLRVLLVTCLSLMLVFGFSNTVFALSANSSAIFNAGINSLRQQNYQQALVDFTKVIENQPYLAGAAYSNRCLVNLELDNYTAAVDDCAAAIKYNPDNLEAYLNLGLADYRQEKYQQAILEYQQLIKRDTTDYRAYYNQGLAYGAINNYPSAIADYQLALNYAPDNHPEVASLIHNDLALAHLMSADHQKAMVNFDQAIALDGNNYQAYYNRGCAYHGQGQYQAAIADFDQSLQINPEFTPAYVHRGILNHQLGVLDTAYQDLNLALEQYQHQGNQEQYDLVLNLKQQLFYVQPSQVV